MIMNPKLYTMWKEAVMAKFTVKSQHLHEVADENHEKPQSRSSMSQLRLKPCTS
jgi:hypothetical protein